MRKLLIGFGILVILLGVVYGGVSWYFSSQLIVFQSVPVRVNDPDAEAVPADKWSPDWTVPAPEVIEIVSSGVTLVGDYYENPAAAACGVIILHGLGGRRHVARVYGPMFYDLGCDVLAYDARAQGDSSTAYITYGYYEKDDAIAALNWLAERANLNTTQIGILGQSYGAATALQMLLIEPNVAFVIADSAYQDMETIVTERATLLFGGWIRVMFPGAFQLAEWRANFETDEVSAVKAVKNVNTPMLLIHSQQDTYTVPSHTEAIYAASNPQTTKLILTDDGAPHAESILANEVESWPDPIS